MFVPFLGTAREFSFFTKAKQKSANRKPILEIVLCVCQNTGFLSNLPTSAYSEYKRIDNVYLSSICPCYDPFLDIHGLMVSNSSSEMTFCMPLVNFTTPKDRKERLTRLPAKVRGRSMTNLTLKQRTRLTNTGPVDGYWVIGLLEDGGCGVSPSSQMVDE